MNENERKAENQYLKETLEIIDVSIATAKAKLSRQDAEVKDVLRRQWEDGSKTAVDFSGLLDMYNAYSEIGRIDAGRAQTNSDLCRLEKQRSSPYFGRMDMIDEGEREQIYIGMYNLRDPERGSIRVHDWRAGQRTLLYL